MPDYVVIDPKLLTKTRDREACLELSDFRPSSEGFPDGLVIKRGRREFVFSERSPFYTGQGEDRELGGMVYTDLVTGSKITVFND